MPEAAEEQLLETPGYMSDLEAAVAGNDETKLAEFYKQHFRSTGGSYFADCAVALKGNHPLLSPPERCLFPYVDGDNVDSTFWVASRLLLSCSSWA